MDAEKIGVSWDGGKMKPQMSVAGVYLISRKDILSDCRDCANCIGQQTAVHFAVTIRKNELILMQKNDKIKNSFYVVKKGGKLLTKKKDD